jgi:hypothetical protein
LKRNDTETAINEIRTALERGESIEVRPLPDEPEAFEIELMQVWKTLRTYWKKIVLITILFVIVGILGGVIYFFCLNESPQPHFDLYEGIKIDSEDDYSDIFSDAEQYYKEINIYLGALDKSIRDSDYKGKKADEQYLTQLKKEIKENYTNTFLLSKNLFSLYSPVRDMDIEKKQIEIRVKQKHLIEEIGSLQQELAYLETIAPAGTNTKGTYTDKAIANGVKKARSIAKLRQEYDKNNELLDNLLDVNGNSEWVQQRKRVNELIKEGISTNERFTKKLNRFTNEYYERQKVSITVFKEPNQKNPKEFNYNVIVGEAGQLLSPLRIPSAIILLISCLGFVFSCLWVLWRYYEKVPRK